MGLQQVRRQFDTAEEFSDAISSGLSGEEYDLDGNGRVTVFDAVEASNMGLQAGTSNQSSGSDSSGQTRSSSDSFLGGVDDRTLLLGGAALAVGMVMLR